MKAYTRDVRRYALLAVAAATIAGGSGVADARGQTAPPARLAPVSATIVGRTLTVAWNQPLGRGASPADFVVRRDGLELPVRRAGVNGGHVVLGLAETAYADDLVDVRYRPTTARGVVDRRGRSARASGWLRARNRSSPGCAPRFVPGEPISEGNTLPGTNLTSVGRLRLLVIPVEFTGEPGATSTEVLRGALLEKLSFLERESRGRLSLAVETLSAWVNVGQPAARYTEDGNPLATDALAAADRLVDFRLYDAVLLATAPSRFFLPSYAIPQLGYLSGEGLVRSVAVIAAQHLGTLAPAHELAHLFGLPDLYIPLDDGSDFSPVGSWDLMSDGDASLLVWHRYKLGWLDPSELRCARTGRREIVLAPLTSPGVHGVVVPLSRTSALVLENRRRRVERGPSCPDGVLAYVFDSRAGSGLGPVLVLPATQTPARADCGVLPDAPFALGNGRRSTFTSGGVSVTLLEQRTDGSIRLRVTRG